MEGDKPHGDILDSRGLSEVVQGDKESSREEEEKVDQRPSNYRWTSRPASVSRPVARLATRRFLPSDARR